MTCETVTLVVYFDTNSFILPTLETIVTPVTSVTVYKHHDKITVTLGK